MCRLVLDWALHTFHEDIFFPLILSNTGAIKTLLVQVYFLFLFFNLYHDR